jgi:tetratricopeptide (TPR) repeat protein
MSVPVRLAVGLLLGVGVGCGAPPPPTPAPAAATPAPASEPGAATATTAPASLGGLGVVTFENSGAPPAQAEFLRGLAWLHSFGYEDAIAAFHAAERLDPDFAMAYWGEAMAFSQPLWFFEEPEKGRAVLARFGPTPEARIARGRTPRERGYLRAVEALWGNGVQMERQAAFRDAMAEVSRAFPADDEARIFHALGILATLPRGDASLPMRRQAGALAEEVFRRNPKHPGAAHLILHAFDHAELAPRGLAAARAYAAIAPEASHALHMPAHFFVQLGYWADAAASDRASWAASVAWASRGRRSVVQRDFHSLTWLQYELTQLGKFAEAQAIATEVDAAIAIATAEDEIGGHFYADSEIGRGSGPLALKNDKGSMRARYVMESERWAEMRGQRTFDNLDELFVLGVAALRLKEDATVALAVRSELQKASAPAMDAGLREQASILLLELEAIAAMGDGITGVALAKMDEAAALPAKMPKPIGRPFPVKGADELYAELLLEANRPAEAVRWFEQTLVRTPNRSRALLGLGRAAAKAGQTAKSRAAYRQFLVNWAEADPGLPELAEARAASGGTR